MDKNELIQIARGCDASIKTVPDEMSKKTLIEFDFEALQQFAQRIRSDAFIEASTFCIDSAEEFTTAREEMAAKSIALALRMKSIEG